MVRTTGIVRIGFIAVDADADTLAITVRLVDASGNSVVGQTTVVAQSIGVEGSIDWDAAAYFGDTGYRSGLVLEADAVDPAGAIAHATSAPFDFGNDAPLLSDLRVDLNNDGAASGLAILRFAVSDSSRDSVYVEALTLANSSAFTDVLVEVDVDASATFPAGGNKNLTTYDEASGDDVAVAHAIAWDSLAALPIDHHEVFMRLVVSDGFGLSNASVFGPFVVDNATSPPTLTLDAVPSGTVSGEVDVAFSLDDADHDPCLVFVEYSQDGDLWTLAASNSDTVGLPTPGSYIFTWQSTQLGFDIYEDVRLRLSAADSVYEIPPVETPTFTVDNSTVAGNSSPIVTLDAVVPASGGRYVSAVPIGFTLNDAESHPVNVQITFATNLAGPWTTATPLGDFQLTNIASSPGGEHYVFYWDGEHDAAGALGGLSHASGILVDSNPSDGINGVATAMVDSTSAVYVRIAPTDAPPPGTTARAGLARTSSPFALGNRPPSVSFGPGTQSLSNIERTGDIAVDFVLTDVLSDLAAAQLEYSTDNGGTWWEATIALGSLTELATLPAGKTHVVVWDSLADLGTTPAVNVRLRLRAFDRPDNVAIHISSWLSSASFVVRNQTPPRIEPLFVKTDGAVRSGRIPIQYRILDAEADHTAVHFEFSTNFGVTWNRCTEYPEPRSEGTTGLASAPYVDAAGVNEHTFVWDVGSDLFEPSLQAQVRATPADIEPGDSVIVLPPSAVGPPAEAPNDLPWSIRDYGNGNNGETVFVDFNGDTLLDMAVVTEYAFDSRVEVFLGDGDGGFVSQGQVDFPDPSGPTPFAPALAIADINEDGWQDLLVGDTDGRVHVRRGTAVAWSFAAVETYNVSTGQKVYEIVTGDWNDNGVLDLAVVAEATSQAGALWTMAGQGTNGAELGTFAAAVIHTGAIGVTPSFGTNHGLLLVRDLDGDGDLDLVAPNNGGGSTACATFNTAGVFGTCTPMGSRSAQWIALGDINGDGFEDLVSHNASTLAVELAIPTNPGTFLPATIQSLGRPLKLELGDVNGDGLADAVVTDQLQNAVQLLLAGRENGLATGQLRGPTTVVQGYPNYLTIADVNKDGLPDMVASGQVGAISVATGALGPASMVARVSIDVPACPWFYLRRAADLDADGRADVLTTCSYPLNQATFHVLLSRSPQPLFEYAGTLPFAGTLLDVADINADGRLDVVAADPLAVAYGTGSPGSLTFAALTPIDAGLASNRFSWPPIVGDFTGDDRLDVAVLRDTQSPSGYEVRVYASNTNGTWSVAASHTQAGASAAGFAAGDINNDGVADLVGAFYSSGYSNFTFLSGVGGTLSGPTTVASGLANMILCDLNEDGILDLVGSSNTGLSVAHGNGANGGGNGSFNLAGSQSLSATYGTARGCFDINGDGYQDVAGTTNNQELFVIASDGRGAMQPMLTYVDTAPWGNTQQLADTNGDGALDFVYGDPGARLHVRSSVFESFRYGWAKGLAPWDATSRSGNVLGDVLISESTHFGAAGLVDHIQPLGGRRYHGEGDEGAADPTFGTTAAASFKDLVVRLTTPKPPGNLKPVTAPWRYTGAQRLLRTHDPSLGGATNTGSRLYVDERYGPRDIEGKQLGLNDTGAFANQRTVIVDLPLRDDITSVTANKIRVYARYEGWVRANAVSQDPMTAAAGASNYLPRVPNGSGGYRDVVQKQLTYARILRATHIDGTPDLDADSGPRFFLEGRVVRVITGRLGVFQAFVVP